VGTAPFLLNGLQLVRTVHSSIHLCYAFSLSLQVCNFSICCIFLAFLLYIEGAINSVKLLGEASLATINA
jgi:hypothetical protein